MKKLYPIIFSAALALSATTAKADFLDYLAGCMVGLAGTVAGTAAAGTKLGEGEKISPAGYGISAGLGCITGIAFTGIVGARAEQEMTFKLTAENNRLKYMRTTAAKERCLLKGTCEPGGAAFIVTSETEITKTGDTVMESTSSKIEVDH